MDKIFEITAKEVTVQVKDERTGVVYNRTLPIDYYENANVLKLSGENLDGEQLFHCFLFRQRNRETERSDRQGS